MLLDADALAAIIASAVELATAPLHARIAVLERTKALIPHDGAAGSIGPMGPPGEKGIDGLAGARGLPGERGERGEKGIDGLAGPMGPPGERGEKGIDGLAGARGMDGAIGPRGADGPAGRDGRDGLAGASGEKGADGLHGTNGADGRPGRDGTLEDLKIVRVDDRTIRFCRKDGTALEGGEQRFDLMIFRKAFEDGRAYEVGDVVVSRGASWVALEPTSTRPSDSGTKTWALVAARGRDGTKGDQGHAGLEGKPGRDLTQLGSDGRKW